MGRFWTIALFWPFHCSSESISFGLKLPMIGFKPELAGVESDSCAATLAPDVFIKISFLQDFNGYVEGRYLRRESC